MYGFSRDDGQIYHETSAPVRSMIHKWMKNSRGRKVHPRYHNRGPGVSSLFNIALRSCTGNADLLSPETLQFYGWELCKMVYKHMKETETLTVNDWCTFRVAFPSEILEDYDLRESQGNTTTPELIGSFATKLATFSSCAFLCVRGFNIRPSDLIELHNFSNLTVLILEQLRFHSSGLEADGTGSIDNAFLRRWARSVQEAGKLPNLKIIILRGFNVEYKVALEVLSNLPNVCLCNLHTDESGPYTTVESGGKWRYLPSFSDEKEEEEEEEEEEDDYGMEGSELETDESNRSFSPAFSPSSRLEMDPYADRHPLGILLERKDLTISKKMKQLYDESTKLSGGITPTVDRAPAVLIDYCGLVDKPFMNSYKRRSIWFQRLLSSAPPSSKPGDCQKRARGASVSQVTHAKKTKLQMRQTKQKDIGSMLGMF